MGNHEQRNWHQYLTDQTRNPEGTHHPPDQSLRWDLIASSISPSDHSLSPPGMLNQHQIFQRLGEMSLPSYQPESLQLLEPPVVSSQRREKASDPQSHQGQSSRPDRTSQELQTLAQAYLQTGNHKHLSADIKADIKTRPFTKTELQTLMSHLKTAQRDKQVNKETCKKLSKIIQRQSEAEKRNARIYEQSETRKEQKQIYEQSETRKMLKARSCAKQTDAQILNYPGVEIFETQDFGSSSQNFTPAKGGTLTKFGPDLERLPLSDEE